MEPLDPSPPGDVADGAEGLHRRSTTRFSAYLAARGRRKIAAEVVVLVVVAIPIIRMILLVRSGTHMQWADYWPMVESITADDGSTRFAGFFEFQNEHPVVVAKVLYWLNLRALDGSNVTLGYVVVLVVAAQVALIRYLLARSSLPFLERSMALVLSSVLLFSMNGSWNFYKSMSGAAWLTANLFALLAITFRHQDRVWLAALSAAVATGCYGTGLSAWVAVLAVGLAHRRPREWWRELPMLAALGAGYAWYQAADDGVDGISTDVGRLADAVATLLTAPLHVDAITFGRLGALVTIGLGAIAVLRRDRQAAPWVGLAAYGLASCMSIAYGRWWYIGEEPTSRYHSLAAIFWIGTTTLVVVSIRRLLLRSFQGSPTPRLRIGLAIAAVAVFTPMISMSRMTDTEETRSLENAKARQDLGAAALRLGFGYDLRHLFPYGDFQGDMQVLGDIGQYPFSSRWEADCGLLGTTLDTSQMDQGPYGLRSAAVSPRFEDGVVLIVAIPLELTPVRCILAVSEAGEVVGVGVLDNTANDGNMPIGSRGSSVLVPDGHESYRIVVFTEGRSRPTLLVDGVSAADIHRP